MEKVLTSKQLELAKKLKRLRDHESASVGEAAAAAAKLQSLLLEYNLDEATIDYASGERPEFGRTRVDVSKGGLRGLLAWKANLMHYVAMHNNVHALREVGLNGEDHGRMTLIGERENVRVVRALYDYLASEIVRLGERHWPAWAAEHPRRQKRVFLDSFYRGGADEIYWRLKAQLAEDKKEHAAQWGIMLLKNTELLAAVEKYAPERKAGEAVRPKNLDAYAMGRRAARNIPFGQDKIGEGRALALEA